MQQIKNRTLGSLTQMKSEMRGLSRTFFKLFTPEGYRNFVKRTQTIAQ